MVRLERSRNAILVLACLMATLRSAAAQSPVPKAHLDAGFALAIQPEGTEDGHYLQDSTLHGVAPGVHLSAGVRVFARLIADVEVTITAPISGEERLLGPGGFVEGKVDHRETIVSALGRWSGGSGRWRIEPSGGISWIVTDTQLDGQLISFNPGFPPQPYTLKEGGTAIAFTGGVDFVRFVSPRVAIAPFFRLHWVRRPGPLEADFRGLADVVYRGGVLRTARW